MSAPPRPRPDLTRTLYRHRGLVPILPILFALVAAEPRPVLVVIGVSLMMAGEGVRLWAAAHLGGIARSSSPRAEKLVTRGPYAHTRNPLYGGNFCLTVGYAIASGAGWPWFPLVMGAGFVLLYGEYVRREEEALAKAFGVAYDRFRTEVPARGWRLTPARIPERGETGRPSLGRALRVEALSINAEFWLLVGLWIRTRIGGG